MFWRWPDRPWPHGKCCSISSSTELQRREPQDARRIDPVRVALANQRDDLLAFAGVLDEKLAAIAKVTR